MVDNKTLVGSVIGFILVGILTVVVFSGFLTAGPAFAFLEPAPEEFEEVGAGNELPDNWDVVASTGTAVELDGQSAYVDDPTDEDVFEDDWSVAMTVEPDEEINDQATHVLYAQNNETVLLLHEAGEWTARYETGGQSAYVDSDADLDGESSIVATWAEADNELALHVDGVEVDTASPTDATESRSTAVSWYGWIDEVRVWDTAVDSAVVIDYDDDAVQPIPEDAAARMMFNTEQEEVVYYADGDTYYSDGDAEFVGDVEFVDGVEPPNVEEGVDYEIETEPVQIRVLDGGYLEDAPVVVATWDDGGALAQLSAVTASVLTGVFALFIIGSFVVAYDRIRNW